MQTASRTKLRLWATSFSAIPASFPLLFKFYCSFEGDSFTMSLNEWTLLTEDCGMVQKKSKACKRADLDRLFIASKLDDQPCDRIAGHPSPLAHRSFRVPASIHWQRNGRVGGSTVRSTVPGVHDEKPSFR